MVRVSEVLIWLSVADANTRCLRQTGRCRDSFVLEVRRSAWQSGNANIEGQGQLVRYGLAICFHPLDFQNLSLKPQKEYRYPAHSGCVADGAPALTHSPSRCRRLSTSQKRQFHHDLPNRLPRRFDPPLGPPPPRLPCRFASSLIHSSRNFGSANFRPSETLVCTWASPASKLSNVGIELIMYVRPSPADMTSGASNSTVQYPTPPSASPTPDSTRSWMRGATTRHVEHQEVVHRVSSGVRDDEESSW